MPKTPTLGAVAAAQDDEKKKAKGASLLAKALGMLGIGGKAAAKMTKKTLVTKRTETEESDDSAEEEEESVPASSATSTEKSSGEASSEMSSAAEEEEGAAASAEEEEEEEAKGKRAGKPEEEEEEARATIAKGWKAAISAYAKATKGVDAYGINGPKGLLRAAEKATGAKGATATLTALHGLRAKAATADAAVIQKIAKVDAKVNHIAAQSRKDRVDTMVRAAKAEGRASNRDLRAQLRAYGNAHGTQALAGLIVTLPKITTEARAPKLGPDGTVIGLPDAEEQAMLAATFGDLPEAQRAAAIADYRAKMKNLNGASKAEA